MKYIEYIFVIILILFGLSGNLKIIDEIKEEKSSLDSEYSEYLSSKKIDGKILRSYINDKNIVIIDTRDLTISNKGYIPNSLLIPLSMIDSWLPKLIKKGSNIIIISDSSNYKSSIEKVISLGYIFIVYSIYEELLQKENGFSIQKVEYNNNTYEEIEKIEKNKGYIIDIREINEFEETGIIKSAHLFPLSTLSENYNEIPKDEVIYVYCKGGVRAVVGMSFLKRLGYKNKFIIMEGGMNKVIDEGYELISYKKTKIIDI